MNEEKDIYQLRAEEGFGADCTHTGQSFICEHCVGAELRRSRELLESSRAVGEQRRIELINETLKCISLQTKLASLCKSINKINDDCLRAEQERDKLKAENEKLKGELNLLERSHEQRNGGEMIQDKLCITITETANGKAEYVQIISGDQVSVNVVLIADKIEINDARSTKVKSK